MDNNNLPFYVCRVPATALYSAYLQPDGWDDWFTFSTLFGLVVFDSDGNRHDIGGVKIGQFGMLKDQRSPTLQEGFYSLKEEEFFSLGQDDSYYENLNKLPENLGVLVLKSLNDLAADPVLFEKAQFEQVTQNSLLRFVSPTTVRGQFHRLTQGGARLSRYKFTYKAPRRVATSHPPIELLFEVEPESNPPTNIHVLIGRNGVGKTYLLNLMTRALVEKEATTRQVGTFASEETNEKSGLFANLVSVTFSAFDPFEPLPEQRDKSSEMQYSYIGLKRTNNIGGEIGSPKSPEILAREFVKSVETCTKGARCARWKRALEMLEADPVFLEANVKALIDVRDEAEFKKQALSRFGRLSSGHKIVLLTITRLVETVEERTLVLLDEPEAHLHPPLLSAFVRALSDLLINRNGVAIIATHSPVVIQEVPRSCVWKLRRNGYESIAERPESETFGENVSILTREVFGLELTQSGFHKLLNEVVEQKRNYRAVVRHFNEELGAEARAIVQALIAVRDASNEG